MSNVPDGWTLASLTTTAIVPSLTIPAIAGMTHVLTAVALQLVSPSNTAFTYNNQLNLYINRGVGSPPDNTFFLAAVTAAVSGEASWTGEYMLPTGAYAYFDGVNALPAGVTALLIASGRTF